MVARLKPKRTAYAVLLTARLDGCLKSVWRRMDYLSQDKILVRLLFPICFERAVFFDQYAGEDFAQYEVDCRRVTGQEISQGVQVGADGFEHDALVPGCSFGADVLAHFHLALGNLLVERRFSA